MRTRTSLQKVGHRRVSREQTKVNVVIKSIYFYPTNLSLFNGRAFVLRSLCASALSTYTHRAPAFLTKISKTKTEKWEKKQRVALDTSANGSDISNTPTTRVVIVYLSAVRTGGDW